MCTYLTEHIAIEGSGKGATGWFGADRATVYIDHAVHAPYTHTVNIGSGGGERGLILKPGARNAASITSVTLNGVAATRIEQASRTDTGSNVCAEYIISAADLPDETAGTATMETSSRVHWPAVLMRRWLSTVSAQPWTR